MIATGCGWTREAVGCLGEAFFANLRQRHIYEAPTFDNIEVGFKRFASYHEYQRRPIKAALIQFNVELR